GLPFHESIEFSDHENKFNTIPVSFLKSNKIVPYGSENGRIHVAVSDVFTVQPLDDLKMMFRGCDVKTVLSTELEIARVITTHFETVQSETTNEIIENLEESDFEILSRTSTETADIL